MKKTPAPFVAILWSCLWLMACNGKINGNAEMVKLLSDVAAKMNVSGNPFTSEGKLNYYDSLLAKAKNYDDFSRYSFFVGTYYLQKGEEQKSISKLEHLFEELHPGDIEKRRLVMKNIAVAWLRLGERTNCIHGHGAESCIFPISINGTHYDKSGSENAISIYKKLLQADSADLESRWLMNIAYMTIGGYPDQVPPQFLIKNMKEDTAYSVKPFTDVAMNMGLDTKNMAGGSIVDDFNNDGKLDFITSGWGLKEGMHYCINNGDGSFSDVSELSGLKDLTGGLNIMQTDYNNDGFKDVFVLRGAWKGEFGKEPNSLLRNNGDGTFTDVTIEAGLLSFHPTQTATWNDFNNDGWLDVFIGNESGTESLTEPQPCELFINNKNGKFTEMAAKAGCAKVGFVKGVVSGDYNNDGKPDLFISTLGGQKFLLENTTPDHAAPSFKDVTTQAGLANNVNRTFPTWFWDYNNDGWLDILVCGYELSKPLSWFAAAEALGRPIGPSGKIFLFKNNQHGGFEEVSEKAGLDKIAFAMGSNFGDIDNDGYLDFYLGTGNPQFSSLVPNKLFRNIAGEKFVDVTTSGRVGNLQKGHGVSFADLDNDGDLDIYVEMGGAYEGDAYQNSLYLNPGQNQNHWLNIILEGTNCNKPAIGARIKVLFTENGIKRAVYRDLNSGGSFGSNPLTQHIGIGQAASIESVEITWPGNKKPQLIKGMKTDGTIKITEGNDKFVVINQTKVDFTIKHNLAIGCAPVTRQ